MKPEDFRRLSLTRGIVVGLVGDYGGDSEWSHGVVIKGNLVGYVVVEHQLQLGLTQTEPAWDAAALISLNEPLKTTGLKSEEFLGNRLLLIQRYPEPAWDNNDPAVHIFGIKDEKTFINGAVLSREMWQPQTIWLAGAAIMTIEEENSPSEMAQAFRKRAERKQLEQLKPTK